MELTHKILDTISRYGMLGKGDRALVGVSGGPDSVFLVHALNDLKRRLGITLCAAHLNHGTRGKESERDAQFVRKLARSLRIKLYYGKLTPLTGVGSKFSPEERLREKRYVFFEKAASAMKCRIVATAHTLDDQAETVLMRIIKGAALRGIVGIHPARVTKNIKFIRPLIEIEKKDIHLFLKNKKIPFRVDRTNSENRFLRNRIRNRVLPYLSKINPRLKRSLSNLAESLRQDFEFIEEEIKKIKPSIKAKKKSLRYVLLRDILLQPKALQKEIVREAFKETGGNIKKLTFRHWRDVDSLIRKKEIGKSLDLPGRVKMRKTRDRIIFSI
jgi:tRNA(Ile)-lysidine synthase